jgi:hypothetical protein
MAVGGDIKEITYNHPRLGSGVFYPKAAEDSEYDLGGLRGDDDANSVDLSGKKIRKLNQALWYVSSVIAWDMNDPNRNDLEKLTALAEDPEEADWTFTHINGTIHGGKGSPAGDIVGNTNNATIAFKVSGGGKLKTIK